MFRFANPYYFFLALPALAALWFVYRKSVTRGVLFSASARLPAQQTTWRIRLSRILPLLLISGLLMSVIALARPQVVFSRIHQTADAIAIEMVVDVSGSMEALDLSEKTATGMKEKTRLEAVKEKFSEFIEKRPDDLIGLVTFGGYATTRAPLTMDHSAIMHILSGVEIPKPGLNSSGQVVNNEELLTAIGDALATACGRIEKSELKSKIIVLLSDGESNTGIIRPEQAIKIAKQLGIKVYTIGIGSRSGTAPFKATDMFGRQVLVNQQCPLDEELLKKIADSTDGQYFHVFDNDGLDKAIEEIDKLEKTKIERDIFEQYNELFPWFLFPGLGLILLGSALNMIAVKRII